MEGSPHGQAICLECVPCKQQVEEHSRAHADASTTALPFNHHVNTGGRDEQEDESAIPSSRAARSGSLLAAIELTHGPSCRGLATG